MAEQTKFFYFSLGKAFEKQTTIDDQSKKQIKTIENHGKKWLNLMNLLKRILIVREIADHLKNEGQVKMDLYFWKTSPAELRENTLTINMF